MATIVAEITISAFKIRLAFEQMMLKENISKLSAFIKSEAFNNVEKRQQSLLIEQVDVMSRYNEILCERLELLGVTYE